MTKSAVSCGFDHLLKKSLMENFIFYAVFSITKTLDIIMFSRSSLDMLFSLGLKIMSNIFMSNIDDTWFIQELPGPNPDYFIADYFNSF